MSLKLSNKHLLEIRTHAENAYPNECCGLLLGKYQDSKVLIEVIATENAWSAEVAETFKAIEAIADLSNTKRDCYAIAPEVMLEAQKEARSAQLDIIGIYHSHPDHPAIPSEFDRVCAWQQYSYIIVSVQQGKACDLKSWRLDSNHQFQPEEIITVTVAPN